ncbi:GATA zinc finger domain-containing protein 14 isoform X2 [Hydra vulgaris]|nr:GATA zinc finger domain-containing protein 14 isoform X2 [Hydra vulgaris]
MPFKSNLIAQRIIVPTLKPIRKNIFLPTFRQYITRSLLTPQKYIRLNDIEQTSSAAKKSTRYLNTLDSKSLPVEPNNLEKQAKEAYEQIQRVLEENPNLTLPPPVSLSLKPTRKSHTINLSWGLSYLKHKPTTPSQVFFPTTLEVVKGIFTYRPSPTDLSFHTDNNVYTKKSLWHLGSYSNNLITTNSPIDNSQIDQSVSWKDYFQFENILKQMGYDKKNTQVLDDDKLNSQEFNNQNLNDQELNNQYLDNQNVNIQEPKNENLIIQKLSNQELDNQDIDTLNKQSTNFNNFKLIKSNNADKRTKVKSLINPYLTVKSQYSSPVSVSYSFKKLARPSLSLYPEFVSSINSKITANKVDSLIHDDLSDEVSQIKKKNPYYSQILLSNIIPTNSFKGVLTRSHITDEHDTTAGKKNISNADIKIIPVRDDNIENKFTNFDFLKVSNQSKNIKVQMKNNATVESLSNRNQTQNLFYYNKNMRYIVTTKSRNKNPSIFSTNNRKAVVSTSNKNNETIRNLTKSYNNDKNNEIIKTKYNFTQKILFNDFKNVDNNNPPKKEESVNLFHVDNEKKSGNNSKEKQGHLKNDYSQRYLKNANSSAHFAKKSLYSNITPPYFNIKPMERGFNRKKTKNNEIKKKQFYDQMMQENDEDFNEQDHYDIKNAFEIQINENKQDNNKQYSNDFINTNSVKDLLDIKYAQIENKLVNDLKLRQAVLQKLEQDSIILEQEEHKKEKLLKESYGKPVSLSTLNEIFREINEETNKMSNESKLVHDRTQIFQENNLILLEPIKEELNDRVKKVLSPTSKRNTIEKLEPSRLEKKSHFTVNRSKYESTSVEVKTDNKCTQKENQKVKLQNKNNYNHQNKTELFFEKLLKSCTLKINNRRNSKDVLRKLLTSVYLPGRSTIKKSKFFKKKSFDLLSKDYNSIKNKDAFTNQSNNDNQLFKKNMMHESFQNRHKILQDFFSLSHSNVSINNRLNENKRLLKNFSNVLNIFYKRKPNFFRNSAAKGFARFLKEKESNCKSGMKKDTEIHKKLKSKHPQLTLDVQKNKQRTFKQRQKHKATNKKTFFNLLRLEFGVHNGNSAKL